MHFQPDRVGQNKSLISSAFRGMDGSTQTRIMENTHMQEKDEIKLENKAKKSPQIMAATIGESVENLCLNRSSRVL